MRHASVSGRSAIKCGVASYDYFKLEPQLAESWEIMPDNSAVVFKLKKDLTFHDGATITARDVKWSFDRFVSVGGFPQRQMEQCSLTETGQFEAIDDHTFKVKFLRPDKLTMAQADKRRASGLPAHSHPTPTF